MIDFNRLKGNSEREAVSTRVGGRKREGGEALSTTSQKYGALLYFY